MRSWDITCLVAELNATLCPITRAKKCKYEIVHSLQWQSYHIRRVFSHTLVPLLCLLWSLMAVVILYLKSYYRSLTLSHLKMSRGNVSFLMQRWLPPIIVQNSVFLSCFSLPTLPCARYSVNLQKINKKNNPK